ncbi:hypothetical protein [Nocardiopsis sp. MG754419]|uniref:hypothetical protein n=1 Tax=Nocardiopsis sp. MG754419 TaxID=2259865 RepID=UPI0020112AF2|nr:hypothetical protein [Nocardiopsis sp. MG754419]
MDDRELWNILALDLTEGTEMTVQPGGVGEPVTYRATDRAEVLPGERGIRVLRFHGRDLEPR